MPVCAKHRIRKAGGSLCPDHKFALIVQESAKPNLKFGDRGTAVPHVAR
jgi:hypothetical protein